jgi:hypothetical protein
MRALRSAVEIERRVERVEERLRLERADVAQSIEVVGDRGAGVKDARLRVAVVDKHHAIRLRDGKWFQQHVMHDREERGVGRHAQRQCHTRRQCKHRIAAQKPQATADILSHRL